MIYIMLLDIRRPYVCLVLFLKSGNTIYYLPDFGIWVLKRSLRKKFIYYRYWLINWYIFSINVNNFEDPYVLMAKELYPDRLLNTLLYISDQLRHNINYICDFWCVKKDIIDQYYCSRKLNNIPIFKYNFNKLPDKIKNIRENFTVFCEELDFETGKQIGDILTNYNYFIQHRQDGKILGRLKSTITKRISDDEFLFRAKEIHGNLYSYSEFPSSSRSKDDKILILCNRCGEYFLQNIRQHLAGQGCPKCNNKWEYKGLENAGRKKISFEEFEKISKEKHNNRYEYVESSYTKISDKVTIIDTITGDIFSQQAYAHSRGEGNPNIKKSRGEYIIKEWLLDNNIDFIQDKSIQCDNLLECRRTVRPDFQLKYNNCIYWIEYNGIQHYKYLPKMFHKLGKQYFLDQIIRDEYVVSYCKSMGIRLVVIPYTYNDSNSIFEILQNCIIEGIDPDRIIIYPDIEKPD